MFGHVTNFSGQSNLAAPAILFPFQLFTANIGSRLKHLCAHCIQHTEHCTLKFHTSQWTLHTAHCIMHTAQIVHYTVLCSVTSFWWLGLRVRVSWTQRLCTGSSSPLMLSSPFISSSSLMSSSQLMSSSPFMLFHPSFCLHPNCCLYPYWFFTLNIVSICLAC